MDIIHVDTILEELQGISDYMKCQVCKNENESLARIKLCGHYSCKNCLRKCDLVCPKCKIFCQDNDLVWENTATETRNILSNLNNLLLQAIKHSEQSLKDNKNNDTFAYENKTYHIHFVDDQKVNAKGETPLHIACKRSKVDNVQNLLTKQVDINAQDFAGWVPLHEAIESRSQDIVEILINHGALLDVPGEGYTSPLHKAVASENVGIVELLLKNGANKNAIDFSGKTPVDCAKGMEEIEQLLQTEMAAEGRVQQLFMKKKIVTFCYYTEPIYHSKLKQHKIKIEENYNPKKVTHFIIRRTHKISIKILSAMLDGCIIVPQEWIDEYLRQNYFISIPNYTFINLTSLNNGMRRAMMNRLLRLPKLFDGMKFYISRHGIPVSIHNMAVSKEALKSLIATGGGKILHRAPTPTSCGESINFPYHASKTNAKCCNYIIFEEANPPELMYCMPELKHKSSKWIVDCAVSFSILD